MTALLEATDTWAHNIDRGKINDVVFLDLKKAFDTVDHYPANGVSFDLPR